MVRRGRATSCHRRCSPRRHSTAVTSVWVRPRSASRWARASARSAGLSNQRPSHTSNWSQPITSASGSRRATCAALASASSSAASAGVAVPRPRACRFSAASSTRARADARSAARPPPAAPGGRPRRWPGPGAALPPAGSWAAGRGRRAAAASAALRRRSCQASINCSMVAAVSSIERRVTSITGQPRLVHSRRAHSNSAFTARDRHTRRCPCALGPGADHAQPVAADFDQRLRHRWSGRSPGSAGFPARAAPAGPGTSGMLAALMPRLAR